MRQPDCVCSGADLNAYSKVENQSGCCSPGMSEPSTGLPIVAGCEPDMHRQLADLLTRYNVNDYAASVKVFAVKA